MISLLITSLHPPTLSPHYSKSNSLTHTANHVIAFGIKSKLLTCITNPYIVLSPPLPPQFALPSSAQYDSASRMSFLFQKDVKSFPTSAVLHVCLFSGIFSLLWTVPGLQKVLNKYLLNEWINAALCLLSPALFVWLPSSHSLSLGLRHLLKIPSPTHCLNRASLHHSTTRVFLLHLFVHCFEIVFLLHKTPSFMRIICCIYQCIN